MASNFRPRVIEITYDVNHNPIGLRCSGETVEGSGRVSNFVVDYLLPVGADRTDLINLLAAIKTAKGL
jgi:hypothetical protein